MGADGPNWFESAVPFCTFLSFLAVPDPLVESGELCFPVSWSHVDEQVQEWNPGILVPLELHWGMIEVKVLDAN